MVLQQKHPFYSIRLKMMFGSLLEDFANLRHVITCVSGLNALLGGTEVAKLILQQKHLFYSIRLKMMFGSVLEDFANFRHVNNLCFGPECTVTGYRSCKNGFATKASILLH